MNIDYKLIGARIKSERKKLEITQEALAEKLNVSIGYVSQVERGITKISLDLLGAISGILQCDIASLITESTPQTKNYRNSEILDEFNKLGEQKKKFAIEMIKLIDKHL